MSSDLKAKLDDAFKPATPLTNGVINETLWQFAPLTDILQGSVATHLGVMGSLVMVWLQICLILTVI